MIGTARMSLALAVATITCVAGATFAQSQAAVPAQNVLAEPFKVVAAGISGAVAETPEWLRVHAAAVVDDWATVRDEAKKLAVSFPQSADIHLALAVGLEGTGDREGAVTALRRAAELNPKHLTGWLMLVQMNFRLDRLEDATRALERARELAPANVEVLMSLAKACVRLGDAERASIVLAGATKAAPDNVEAWVNYLVTSASTKRAETAWREFEQLEGSHPAVAASVRKLLPAGVTPPKA